MKIRVQNLAEDGTLSVDSELSRTEVAYLVQYAINSLMAKGVMFDFSLPIKDEEDMRMKVPEGSTIQ